MTRILCVNKNMRLYEQATTALSAFHLKPKRVDTMQDAISTLSKDKEFLCIMIDEDDTPSWLHYLPIMRELADFPIFILTTTYTTKKHAQALRAGAHYYGTHGDTIEGEIDVVFEMVKQYNNCGSRETANVLILGDIILFLSGYYMAVQGVRLPLTRIEFELLYIFMINSGSVLTFEKLFGCVWGADSKEPSHEVLWTAIKRLRKKLKVNSDCPEYIENVRGVGYRFVA